VRSLFGNEEGRSLFVSWKVVIDPRSRMSLLLKQSKNIGKSKKDENKLLKIFLKLDKTIKMVMFFEEMLIPLLPN